MDVFKNATKTLYLILICCVMLTVCKKSYGQTYLNQDPRGYGVGLVTGSFLPLGISGVRDLLPIWGVRLAHPFRRTQLEYVGTSAKAKGVTYYHGFVSLRNPIRVPNQLFVGHWIIGLDYHTWKRKPTKIFKIQFPFRYSSGWHLGFGARVPVSPNLSFRGDFRYGFGPGDQLVVSLGFEYLFPTSE